MGSGTLTSLGNRPAEPAAAADEHGPGHGACAGASRPGPPLTACRWSTAPGPRGGGAGRRNRVLGLESRVRMGIGVKTTCVFGLKTGMGPSKGGYPRAGTARLLAAFLRAGGPAGR